MMKRSQSWNDSGGSDGGYGTSSGRTSVKSGSPYQTQHSTLYEYIQDDVLLFETNEDGDEDQQQDEEQRLAKQENKSDDQQLGKVIQRRTRRKSTNDIKVCLVCGDKATGYHFNAMTCEGCKGFFRRSVKNSRRFACAYQNECEINPHNRRKCQACRYNKCLQIGMKSDCVLNDDELEEKRRVIVRNRIRRLQRAPTSLAESDNTTVDTLIQIYDSATDKTISPQRFRSYETIKKAKSKTGDSFLTQLEMQNETIELSLRSPKAPDEVERVKANLNYVAHFSDYITAFFYETINYCKQIHDFQRLPEEDQICLLQAASWEMMLLQSCQFYNASRNEFELDDMGYGHDDMKECGLDSNILQRIFAIAKTIKSMDLSKDELVIVYTLIIFCEDRKGLGEVNEVSQIQERYAVLLQKLMNLSANTGRRNGKNKFPEIIFMLSEARCIAFLMRPLFEALNEQFADVLPTLMKEMIL